MSRAATSCWPRLRLLKPKRRKRQSKLIFNICDTEEIAPSTGLAISRQDFTSKPDGNTINIQFIRPESGEALPCVYYIHGGGMQTMSCYDGNYRAWGRIIAQQGVAVAMVDFRNALTPSSVPEVKSYPAGLNDCVSGLEWVAANGDTLGIDPGRMIIAGESGGGNLTLATGMRLLRDGRIDLIQGLYAMCPYIAGIWPLAQNPSSIENNGYLMDLHNNRGAMAYGIEELERKNPLAWPGFAKGGRRTRASSDRDQRQRVRPAARRGRQLLSPADSRGRPGGVPTGHGDAPRHRGLPDRLSRDQPRDGAQHRRLLPGSDEVGPRLNELLSLLYWPPPPGELLFDDLLAAGSSGRTHSWSFAVCSPWPRETRKPPSRC